MTLQDWAEHTGLPRSLIAQRIDRLGWSANDALSLPANAKRHSRKSLAAIHPLEETNEVLDGGDNIVNG